MARNLKQRIQSGEQVVGTMIKVVDTIHIAKVIKEAGFDYFIIDNEHGFFDYKFLSDICLYSKAIDITCMIRIPQVTREIVLKCVDMGAGGLMLPSTETVEQAQKLVEYALYAPEGDRGVNLFAAHAQYAPGDTVQYMKKANEEMILYAQIESPRGVEALNDILSIKGIDVAFIGPNDFSQSIALPGQFDHPEFEKYMDRIIEIAKKCGKQCGIHLGSVAGIKKWQTRGMYANLYSNELNLMTSAAKSDLEKIRI